MYFSVLLWTLAVAKEEYFRGSHIPASKDEPRNLQSNHNNDGRRATAVIGFIEEQLKELNRIRDEELRRIRDGIRDDKELIPIQKVITRLREVREEIKVREVTLTRLQLFRDVQLWRQILGLLDAARREIQGQDILDEPYKCHYWTPEERMEISGQTKNSEKDVCTGAEFTFTGGDDTSAPGCGDCWCCEPSVRFQIKVQLLQLYTDISLYMSPYRR